MEIKAGQIIVNPRDTIYKADAIKNDNVYCSLLSSIQRKNLFGKHLVRPYFLQFDQKIILDMESYRGCFVVKNIFYDSGTIKVTCRHMNNIDIETDFPEWEIIKFFAGYA